MKTIQAIQCAKCGTLHDQANGKYISIPSAQVQSHFTPDEADPPEPQAVCVEDVIVCNNKCLGELLALKGF